MKWLLLGWFVVSAVGQLHAQPADSGGGLGFTEQQQRLDAQRHALERQIHEDERACRERFAVNDCLKAARSRNLAKTADLRRQQERLNAFERGQRAEEQIRRQEEKTAQHAQSLRDAAARSDLRAESKRDSKISAQRNAAQGTEGGSPPARVVDRAVAHSQPMASTNREAYQRKLQESEKRRQERDKRIREKASGKPSAPLPPAP